MPSARRSDLSARSCRMRIWTPWRRGVPLSGGFASRLPRTAGPPEGLESASCARLAMRPLRRSPSPAHHLGACACPPAYSADRRDAGHPADQTACPQPLVSRAPTHGLADAPARRVSHGRLAFPLSRSHGSSHARRRSANLTVLGCRWRPAGHAQREVGVRSPCEASDEAQVGCSARRGPSSPTWNLRRAGPVVPRRPAG